MNYTPEQQAEHRDQLCKYLLSGRLEAEFNMGRFANRIDKEQGYCGSVGCAVGHIPYATGIRITGSDSWIDFSEAVLGIKHDFGGHWRWCFDAYWRKTDNTPQGAALRIRYWEQYGVPDNWLEQMNGEAPLCYREGA